MSRTSTVPLDAMLVTGEGASTVLAGLDAVLDDSDDVLVCAVTGSGGWDGDVLASWMGEAGMVGSLGTASVALSSGTGANACQT